MALIVGGTTVTGTQTLDATTLTGDLPAISAANLTNVPAGSPPTAWSQVGAYAFCNQANFTTPNSVYTGFFFLSNANAGSASSNTNQYSNSGSWRAMGYASGYTYGVNNTTLFLRVS